MYSTYHLSSAQELNADIIEAIKVAFKSKPITITIEDEEDYKLIDDLKEILDDRLLDSDDKYSSMNDFITSLKKDYDL